MKLDCVRDRLIVSGLLLGVFAIFCLHLHFSSLTFVPRLMLLNAASELYAGVRPGMLRSEIRISETERWIDPSLVTSKGYAPSPIWDEAGPITAYDKTILVWSFRLYVLEQDGVVRAVLLSQW